MITVMVRVVSALGASFWGAAGSWKVSMETASFVTKLAAVVPMELRSSGQPAKRSRPVKTPWVMDVEMEAEGGTWIWRTRRWRWLKMRSPAEKGSKYNGLLREVFLVEHRHGSRGI